MRKLSMEELNRKTVEEFRESDKMPIVVVMDNIRSMHNVGSVFRTADAFLLQGICLCGYTPQPPHRDIHKTALGATETVAAIGYAAFSISMTIGRLSGDWLVHRFGNRTLVKASGLIASVGIAIAVFSPSPWISLAGFVLVGAGFATVVPCVFSAAGRMPGVQTGVALASVTTMGYLGFLIGPPLIGFVAEGIGLKGALAMLIGTNLLVTALSGRLR